MTTLIKYSILVMMLLVSQPIYAHPVIWKNGNAVMAQSTDATTQLTYAHSLSPNWALGVHHIEFKNDENRYLIGQSNWLIKRWNKSHSQGNIYLLSGIGVAENQGSKNPILHIGGQLDWENRRLYSYLKAEYYSLNDPVMIISGRLGVAPYLGQFNDLHTWIIIQANDHIIGNQHTVSVLPVIRLFKDNVLIEFGSNFSGSSLINAMFHF